MIHYHMEQLPGRDAPVIELQFSGAVSDVSAELLALVHMIYGSIAKENRGAAGLFKGNLQDVLEDDKSMVWDLADFEAR